MLSHQYSWRGLGMRYASFALSFVIGASMAQQGLANVSGFQDWEAVLAVVCLVWFLISFILITAFRCPRCGKRFFPFFKLFYGGRLLRNSYRERNFAPLLERCCMHCGLPMWSAGDDQTADTEPSCPIPEPDERA